MTSLFLDTSYFIAIVSRRDDNHRAAEGIHNTIVSINNIEFYTFWLVLTELLGFFGGKGKSLRVSASRAVRSLLDEKIVKVISTEPDDLDTAFNLYSGRIDKPYSLVDCHIMISIWKLGLSGVISFDGDFAKEGIHTIRSGQDALLFS